MARIFTIAVALTILCGAVTARAEAQALDSPRLSSLLADVTRGSTSAVESFWQEVESRGAPLVERLGDDRMHALVTFLWRGDARTKNVVVTGQLGQYGGLRLED